MNSPQTSRRRFLQSAAASSAILGFPAITSCQSPNSKMNLGLIGVGGRGRSHVKAALDLGEPIVAMVDVNENNLGAGLKQAPKARSHKDFRDFFEKMDDIDAVFVSTTEHTHAFATLPPLKAGKHVYCEKPLTRDVHECRIITEAAAKAGVQTQMGTQVHSSENFRRVVEAIGSGAIGHVKECHVWTSRAWGWQTEEEAKANKDLLYTPDTPTRAMPVPDGLDWDLWLGPAPYRDFHEFYFPGPRWYRWWDFGNGTMSDLGSHRNDLPFWALKLDAPLTIEPQSGPKPHHDIAPATMSVKYTYGARNGDGGELPPVDLTWYQGNVKPKIWNEGGIPQWKEGCLFIGEEGMLLADYGKNVLLPEDKFEKFERPKPYIDSSPGQQAEFILACKGEGPQPLCHFGYSGPLTEANHLGNVAYRADQKLEWDAKNMKFPNAPEAEKFLGREYRDGWSLE
ncbi:MAG: Gfo/Idh/MocA family oxidoreductase [Verrucomicrobiales bacterium]|nr:Gfo/Idh/MocA family oxidoreductase [Verrucomicrobiales bacterium]